MVEQLGLPDAAVTPQAIDVDWSQAWPAVPVVVLVVVIAIEVRGWLRRRRRPEAPTVGPVDLPDDVRRTINAHLADRRPINAVKVYRQATGAGLADAKRAIDNWPEA